MADPALHDAKARKPGNKKRQVIHDILHAHDSRAEELSPRPRGAVKLEAHRSKTTALQTTCSYS